MYVNECMERFNKVVEKATLLYPHFHTTEDVVEWLLSMAEDELDLYENKDCSEHHCECSAENVETCCDCEEEVCCGCGCGCHEDNE